MPSEFLTTLRPLLAAWPPNCQPGEIESLGAAGGFSGAKFWRLESPRGQLVLRRWPPEHPTPDRLHWIHQVLVFARHNDFQLVPAPVPTLNGNSIVRHDGSLWQLEPWMPGQPCRPDDCDTAIIEKAMTALAQFHEAIAGFERREDVSPGIGERQRRLQSMMSGGIDRLAAAVDAHPESPLAKPARQLFKWFPTHCDATAYYLADAVKRIVPLQPCLRDVWSDHILFDAGEVSGLIDFGAMRLESVAADIARLLGSMAGNDLNKWEGGLDAYLRLRHISAAERELVGVFDRSTSLLAGLNWIEWIFCDGRHFGDLDAVAARLTGFRARLAGE